MGVRLSISRGTRGGVGSRNSVYFLSIWEASAILVSPEVKRQSLPPDFILTPELGTGMPAFEVTFETDAEDLQETEDVATRIKEALKLDEVDVTKRESASDVDHRIETFAQIDHRLVLQSMRRKKS